MVNYERAQNIFSILSSFVIESCVFFYEFYHYHYVSELLYSVTNKYMLN